MESGKAAAIAGVGGTLGSLPYLLTMGSPPLAAAASIAAVAASCMLFGVTYRYALRQDLRDGHLKGGVVAAFGLVRGLAQADAVQQAAGGNLLDISVISQVTARSQDAPPLESRINMFVRFAGMTCRDCGHSSPEPGAVLNSMRFRM